MIDQSQIPPEIMLLLEELSQGGIAEDQNDLLAAQYKTADQMRRTPNPQGRTVRDQFIAQNPLEQIAATAQQIQGGVGQRDAMNQMNANLGTTGKGVRALMLAKLLRDYPAKPDTGGMNTTPPVAMGEGPAWLGEDPLPPTPGMGLPGQEGPDITEGRSVRRKPIPAPVGPKSYGTTGMW